MKILLTGASGFIAGRIAEHLIQKGHILRCILRKEAPEELVKRIPTAQFVVGSFLDDIFLKRSCEDIDVVVHCAGLAGTWGTRDSFWKANVEVTRQLAKAANECHIQRWIQLSSPSIYFEFKDQENIDETFLPKAFSSFYAESKYEADRILFENKGFRTIALRPRFVLGKGDQQIVPRMLRFMNKGFYPLVGDGKQKIDVTNISNVCQAVEISLNAPESAWGEVYNISNGSPIRFLDLIQELKKRILKPVKIFLIPKKLTSVFAFLFRQIEKSTGFYKDQWLHPLEVGVMTQSMSLNIDKAKNKLGYFPESDFKKALEEYLS